MSADTLTFFNLALHSLLLSLLGWLAVRLFVRDARRRAHAALMAILLALIAPWAVSAWPYPHGVNEAPVLSVMDQGLPLEWRIKVDAAPVQPLSPMPSVERAPASLWRFDDAARVLCWLWWGGFLMMALRHLWQSWCASQWRRSLRVPTEQEWRVLPASVEITALRVFDHDGSPCVVGLLRPVIAVQASAFQSLSADQWRWLLRHEGEHLRSGDVAHAWLLGWARAFAWWNSFVHALIECWAQSREQVCDAIAVEDAAARESYAEFLLDVAAHKHSTAPGTVPMAQSRPARRLRARLAALMQGTAVRERLGWLYLMTAATSWLLGCGLIASVGITAQAQDKRPFAEAAATGEMLTRVFRVPPDFLLRLGDASAPAKAGLKANKLTAKQWLEKVGVAFPDGAMAVFNPVTSQLIVKHTEAGLQQVERWVSQASHIPPFVYVTTRFIHGEQWSGMADQMMSAEETKTFWTSVSQKPGIDLLSAPSVTTKIGQKATVEVVKEGFVVVESNPAGEPVTVESKLAGVQVEVDSKPAKNGRLELRLGATLMMDPSRAKPWDLSQPETIDWTRLITVARKVVGEFSVGQSMAFNLPTQPHPTTVLITAEAVKPDGTKTTSFDDRIDLLAGGNGARVKTLPGSSYEKALQEAEADKESFDKRRVRQVFISAKVVDVVQAADEKFDFLSLPLLDTNNRVVLPVPQVSGPKNEPSTLVATAVPSIVALQGVFNDAQFQVVLRALSQKKGVALAMLPNVMVSSGKKADILFPAVAGKGALHATPTLGPDGFTLDLELKVEMGDDTAGPPGNRPVTTAVTIWDGQTVVLGGLMKEDEQARHARLIFVTGKIVDPQGQQILEAKKPALKPKAELSVELKVEPK